MSVLNRPYFRDEEATHAFLEGIVWPESVPCPHRGVIGSAYKIAATRPVRPVEVPRLPEAYL